MADSPSEPFSPPVDAGYSRRARRLAMWMLLGAGPAFWFAGVFAAEVISHGTRLWTETGPTVVYVAGNAVGALVLAGLTGAVWVLLCPLPRSWVARVALYVVLAAVLAVVGAVIADVGWLGCPTDVGSSCITSDGGVLS